MAKVEFDVETSLEPERVMEALLDFSERRPEIWSDLAPEFYEVHSVEENTAEVKEGSILPGIKIWAVEQYSWKRSTDYSVEPGVVSWKALECNFCEPGGGMEVTIASNGSGGSKVHATWQRVPTTFVGRMLIGAVVLSRGGVISWGMKKTLDGLAATSTTSG